MKRLNLPGRKLLGILLVGLVVMVIRESAPTLMVVQPLAPEAAPVASQPPKPEAAAVTYFATLPPASPLPSGEHCAQRVRRSTWEPRPENTVANHTVPETVSVADWEDYDPRANTIFKPRIDGKFKGTTDEIIQWGACKWGLDENVIRAMAVRESNWVQAETGDFEDNQNDCVAGDSPPCPTSFGLLQIKHFYYPGTYPDSLRSTAFNVDYVLGKLRACYEGWIPWLAFPGSDYIAGDLWGCVGFHWSGDWKDQGSDRYVEGVQSALAAKPWMRWDG